MRSNKQMEFAANAKNVLEKEDNVLALGVGGSWITNEMDEYSDLDLIIITKDRISQNPEEMKSIAMTLGDYLSGFIGEHVNEPRVLICLYKDPLLHVDLKFITMDELEDRVENPILLFDKTEKIQEIFDQRVGHYPTPNFQWIEDRFWTWVHYIAQKIKRGELLEAFDFFSFLRATVLGPLIQFKNQNEPRGVRKVETKLKREDFELLSKTIPTYDVEGLRASLVQTVILYKYLQKAMYTDEVHRQKETEKAVMKYLESF